MTTTNNIPASVAVGKDGRRIECRGNWQIQSVAELEATVAALPPLKWAEIIIDGSRITNMDSAGAWLLLRYLAALKAQDKTVSLVDFNPKHQSLVKLLSEHSATIKQWPAPPKSPNAFWLIGEETIDKYKHFHSFFAFVGESIIIFMTTFLGKYRMHWRGLLNNVETMGYRAMPIVALLLFLIGIVLVYQMGVELQIYGANIYIVNVAGIAILREFGPLITAIIVAGRTGSAYTAQIGTMIVNQEVDALQTMGVSPISRLALPKILGLMVALPLLTLWADIMGILGSMVMSQNMLGISYVDFLNRFPAVVEPDNFWIGIGKAPVFAMIIATVGCFQGFQVSGGANSVGQHTTKSVVQAIFLIIIADAFFSVIFTWQGI